MDHSIMATSTQAHPIPPPPLVSPTPPPSQSRKTRTGFLSLPHKVRQKILILGIRMTIRTLLSSPTSYVHFKHYDEDLKEARYRIDVHYLCRWKELLEKVDPRIVVDVAGMVLLKGKEIQDTYKSQGGCKTSTIGFTTLSYASLPPSFFTNTP